MARRASSTQASTRSASFVVLLSFEGVYRGMAGPLDTADAAQRWAEDVVAGEPGWTWVIEPVIAPGALPSGRERAAARRPHLRVVR